MARHNGDYKQQVIEKYKRKKLLKKILFIVSIAVNIYLGIKVYGG